MMKSPAKFRDNFWPRAFSDLFESESLPEWSKRFYDGESTFEIPSVNVKENENDFQVEVVAPGFEKKDFKIDCSDGTLTLQAEREENKEEAEKGEMKRREFSYSSIKRSFSLPANIDEKGIRARYENGILHLRLPKMESEEAPPAKTIKVG